VSDILITRGAFSHFYGSTFCFLVGAEVYARVQPMLPQEASIFILRADGVIVRANTNVGSNVDTETATAENAQRDKADQSETMPLIGMCIGLQAIIVSGNRQVAVAQILEFCKKQGMFQLPTVYFMRRWHLNWKQSLNQFITGLLWEYGAVRRADLATVQRQMVQLRGNYERLWLSFEKARRMIRGIGYSTRSVAFSLSAGSNSVGPTAANSISHYEQYLPSDLAGFAGINLFVSQIAAEGANGVLFVRISRRADNAKIGEASLSFSEIGKGWLSFTFDDVVPLTLGDGILEVVWQGRGGPLLAMAEGKADRFGDTSGRSLAMQIIKGLADPTLNLNADDMPLERMRLSGDSLLERSKYYAGKEAERAANSALGDHVLQTNTEDGWLQTHLIADGVAGIRLADIVPKHTKEIRVGIESAHAAAPTSIYMMLAVRSDMPRADIDRMLMEIGRDGDQPLAGADVGRSLYWSSAILGPEMPATLSLMLDDSPDEALDLILAVRSLNGSADYGHCRWHWLEIGSVVGRAVDLLPLEQDTMREGLKHCGEIRSHRLPELAGQLSFYKGRAELGKLSEKLGFSPFLVSEETGALQTHPYDGQMSAAVLGGGLPVGTRRLSCEVGSAHASAPEFTYMLAILPRFIKDQEAVITDMAARVSAGESKGFDSKAHLQWSSITLKALEVSTLVLEPWDIPEQVGDVVFAAIPTGDNVSYGWCRWYSFEAALMGVGMAAHRLERPFVDVAKAP